MNLQTTVGSHRRERRQKVRRRGIWRTELSCDSSPRLKHSRPPSSSFPSLPSVKLTAVSKDEQPKPFPNVGRSDSGLRPILDAQRRYLVEFLIGTDQSQSVRAGDSGDLQIIWS